MKQTVLTSILFVSALILTLAVVLLGFGIYRGQSQAAFKDVTVELGTQSLSVEDFLTDPEASGRAAFVSDVSRLDIGTVGSTPVTLRKGQTLQTVTLTVQDTTAPMVEFQKSVTVALNQQPNPKDFVVSVDDRSETSVTFVEEPVPSEDHADLQVTVAVTDLYGNTTTGEVTLRYDWVYPEVILELGTTLTKAHILPDPEKDGHLITDEAIHEINLGGIGKYVLTVQSGDSIRNCSITVQDTLPPELELKEISLLPDWTCTMKDFVVSATDASGPVELELLSQLPFGVQGDHPVQIKATDKNGLSVIAETKLRIHNDITPPTIYGLYTIEMTANQPEPDYDTKVYAYDKGDGNVAYTYDTSDVDLTRAGIYYVVYTAADSTGNVAVKSRKVVIKPDYASTEKLIEDIAASLDKTDPESIRDFVRNNIVYTPEWGGKDPTAYGFTKWRGNCYVHALCLQALLEYFGYETELIWVKPQYDPHYWLIINLDGKWYHIDATPGNTHTRYSLMNNKQRLDTLRGRRWDTSLWPQINENE